MAGEGNGRGEGPPGGVTVYRLGAMNVAVFPGVQSGEGDESRKRPDPGEEARGKIVTWGPGSETMTKREMDRAADETYARRLRELASDLADRVASGDLTEEEANAWLGAKQDLWTDAPWG